MLPDDEPTTARSTQFNHPMSRRLFAGILRWRADHQDPQDGEVVAIVDRETGKSLGEGRWEYRDDQPEGTWGAVVYAEGGPVTVPGGATTTVTTPLPRPRPAVLTSAELSVTAELLAELGAVYAGEPLGAVADQLARRISDELGLDLTL
jgi:hypothetical protein